MDPGAPAVGGVDDAPAVDEEVVGLDRLLCSRGSGDVAGDFLWCQWIGNIHDPDARVEVADEDVAVADVGACVVLVEIVGAEPPASPSVVSLGNREAREDTRVLLVLDVDDPDMAGEALTIGALICLDKKLAIRKREARCGPDGR